MQSIDRIRGSNGLTNASLVTIQDTRAANATVIVPDTVVGLPPFFYGSMGEAHSFIDPVTNEEVKVISEATAVDFAGKVVGTNIEIDFIAPGYVDNGSNPGDIVVVRPTTGWANNVADVLDVSHNDDGTLKDGSMGITGEMKIWSTASAPTGWLVCDGTAISRTTYSGLYGVIGTIYGHGDGSTTFNVPDMKGRVPVGFDSGQTEFDTLGKSGGAMTHSHSSGSLYAELEATGTSIKVRRTNDNFTAHVAASLGWSASSASASYGTNVAGSTAASSSMIPYQTINYIIKA